ncbi:MAG: enhanced serine sensitivity protein SseB [Clostridia bacterium]|nr:enhanced serine sensitivity protein SseB [Clostridia bacterium]
MDINNKELINSINVMKEEKTLEAQNKVITEVLKAKFMCPVILESAPKGGGRIDINKDTKIQFSIIKTTDGKNYLIAFTSDEEVHKWQKNKIQQSLIYTFEDYAMIATNNETLDGFIIDPKGCNLVFTKEMIKEIKASITRESVVEKDTQVELGIPKNYPTELVEKLKDVFANIGTIKKAYLQLMVKDEAMSYLVLIDADGNEKEHFNTIASAAIPFLNGMPLNLAPLNTEFGQKAIENFEPFYVKE